MQSLHAIVHHRQIGPSFLPIAHLPFSEQASCAVTYSERVGTFSAFFGSFTRSSANMCLNVKSGTSNPSIKDLARSYKAPDHQLISVGAGEWQQCLKDGMLALSSDSKYVKGDYLLPSVLDCFSFPCRCEPLSRRPSCGLHRLVASGYCFGSVGYEGGSLASFHICSPA